MSRADALADWPTNSELIAEQLRADPEFRAEWERAADARAVAVAIVRYRDERDLRLEELAGLLGMTTAQVAALEAGDANTSADTPIAISAQLGIEPRASQKECSQVIRAEGALEDLALGG